MRQCMKDPASNRRIVAKASLRQKLFIGSRLYRADGTMVARVFVDELAYDVRQHELEGLFAGHTPDELDLEPAPDPEAELS